MQSLPSCPECGGRRALFECRADRRSVFIPLDFFTTVRLYACVCLTCGHTTLRVRPDALEWLREAEEKGKTVQF